MGLISVYITASSKKEAENISLHLLNKKLIACANIFPIESLYSWKGEMKKEKEFVLLCKTLSRNYKHVKLEVEKIHSYKCPCILKFNIKANDKYGIWVKEQLN